MTDQSTDGRGKVATRPLDPDEAKFLRTVTTHLGMHLSCPFKVCRRARACATRHVVCYQATQEHVQPIVWSIKARLWRDAVARGEEISVAPAYEGDMRRLLAWEERETDKIIAGDYGDDDALSPHQLWLKRHARGARQPRPVPTSSTLP